MKRTFVTISLVVTLLATFMLSGFAAYSPQYDSEAENLKLLGVFQGTGGGFELEREPSRLEGLVMMVRLLGKEAEAKVLSTQPCIFTDVPAWAVGYVNYAYKNGMTKGIGGQLFGSIDKMNAKSYLTLMLRSLGYNDTLGDFTYDKAIEFSGQINMISLHDVAELTAGPFLRDHVARVSCLALRTNTKGKEDSLLETLVSNGAMNALVADQYLLADTDNVSRLPAPSLPTVNQSAPPSSAVSPGVSNGGVAEVNGIIIEMIDKVKELVTIRNTSLVDVNLTSYVLVSETGNQQFVFPSYVLQAGARVTVTSGDAEGDLVWTTANMWNNSKSDPGTLYDANGKIVFRFED